MDHEPLNIPRGRADRAECAQRVESGSDGATAVERVIAGRRSVRAFTGEPVPMSTVERILAMSARSPSNSNTQPWFVHVLTGQAKERLSADLIESLERGGKVVEREFQSQPAPEDWIEPFRSRRQQFGQEMYGGTLGLGADDLVGRANHHRRNYEFFGAPVGLVLTVSRHPLGGALVDAGIFLQTLALAARAFELDTCPQAAFIDFYPILRAHMTIPDDHVVVCGVALGHADTGHPLNNQHTPRVPVSQFTHFYDA